MKIPGQKRDVYSPRQTVLPQSQRCPPEGARRFGTMFEADEIALREVVA